MSASEDDFVWLLNTLKSGAKDFETLYGVGFVISDTIIIKQGEPKNWLYSDSRGLIRSRDEEWLKLQVVKEYLKNPSIQQEDLHDIENMNESPQISNLISATSSSGNLAGNSSGAFKMFAKSQVKPPSNNLFYFFQNQKGTNIVRTATAPAADLLMTKPQDYVELLSHWSKIIAYHPINQYKGSVLYSVQYNGKNKRCQISRKNIESKQLDPAEFLKKEGQQKKTFEFEQKVFKSLAAGVNEKCNHFVLSLVRYIENKFHKLIRELWVEFFMNDSGKIYLSGADRVFFAGADGEAEIQLDKTQLTTFKGPQVEAFKCKGQYCHCAGDPTYYDETDEAFSVFIQPQPSETEYFVQFKSIFMDQIERNKTIQAIKAYDKNIRVTEQLIFRARKYYSFSKIAGSNLFGHMKFDNVYKQIRVCQYCHALYSKLDNLRVEFLSQRKRKQVTEEDIRAVIERMSNLNGVIIGGAVLQEKRAMSDDFYEKLKLFDTEVDDFKRNFIVTKSVDPSFFSTSLQRKQQLRGVGSVQSLRTPGASNTIVGSGGHRSTGGAAASTIGSNTTSHHHSKTTQNFFSMTQQQPSHSSQSRQDFALPQIVELSLKEKSGIGAIGNPRKKRQVSKADAEALGLKHYLGHTKNLPYSDCGLAISKSSLALNHLQDKINEVQQLKAKMETNRIKREVEEIAILMCPYYGNGKVDETRLNEYIAIVKDRNIELNEEESAMDASRGGRSTIGGSVTSPSAKKVQIVTDKNEFLSDAQRKQKQEREKKAKEIEENKKNFLEENRELAVSVLKMGQEERKAKQMERRRRDLTMKTMMYQSHRQNTNTISIAISPPQQQQNKSNGIETSQQDQFITRKSATGAAGAAAASAAIASQQGIQGRHENDDSLEDEAGHSQDDSSLSESKIEDNPSMYRPTDFSLLHQDV